jgi:hypothetical protein
MDLKYERLLHYNLCDSQVLCILVCFQSWYSPSPVSFILFLCDVGCMLAALQLAFESIGILFGIVCVLPVNQWRCMFKYTASVLVRARERHMSGPRVIGGNTRIPIQHARRVHPPKMAGLSSMSCQNPSVYPCYAYGSCFVQ